LSGADWPNASSSRQFIGRIAAQRNEVGYLLGVDAISLAHLFGPDVREFRP
jgi:hypothetical protein